MTDKAEIRSRNWQYRSFSGDLTATHVQILDFLTDDLTRKQSEDAKIVSDDKVTGIFYYIE